RKRTINSSQGLTHLFHHFLGVVNLEVSHLRGYFLITKKEKALPRVIDLELSQGSASK
ncbi:Hypothetical predicted protein, partial [Prunus dulcis]